MLVGIHKDPYGRFSKFLEIYENILRHNDIVISDNYISG